MEPVSAKIDIEPILELSAEAQIRRHALAFHARTETVVHTTLWQVKFAAFLERLSAPWIPQDGLDWGSHFHYSKWL
jgi:hypothetical protein